MSSDSPIEYFESAKTAARIPITAPLVREALIQFTLDAAVRRIEIVPSATVRGVIVPLDAIVLAGDAGRELLEFPELAATRDLDAAGLELLAVEQLKLRVRRVTTAEIRREPRASNCRTVWACRHRRVSVDDWVRLLDVLGEEGPMALSRAAAEMRFAGGAISAVLALACTDLIEIDLESALLGPETLVRRRAHNKE